MSDDYDTVPDVSEEADADSTAATDDESEATVKQGIGGKIDKIEIKSGECIEDECAGAVLTADDFSISYDEDQDGESAVEGYMEKIWGGGTEETVWSQESSEPSAMSYTFTATDD